MGVAYSHSADDCGNASFSQSNLPGIGPSPLTNRLLHLYFLSPGNITSQSKEAGVTNMGGVENTQVGPLAQHSLGIPHIRGDIISRSPFDHNGSIGFN